VALAAGDLDTAGAATAELEATAERFGSPALHAGAATARGALRLAAGDPDGALASLRWALAIWQELDAPWEAARVRVQLAAAFGRAGDEARFAVGLGPSWPDPADDQANLAWGRAYDLALRPFAMEGGYVNFMAGEDQGQVPATYRHNYRRLVEVKRRHDPGNLFRLNQNVHPASLPAEAPTR
jgi:hypothetical protein